MAGGLDHLVVVAHDLDAQADLYRRLGFQVGARNRHAWGTLNHIVQFDGVFLELLTTEPGFVLPPAEEAVHQFAGPIADYLSKREGLAMMVLEGFDSKADQLVYDKAGIAGPETFYFGREGRRPDGEPVEVAFTLAFARSEAIKDAGFFVCQQHAPEMFWNAGFQAHENGANGVRRIVFASQTPDVHRVFFETYLGVKSAPIGRDGLRFALDRSMVEVLTPAACAAQLGADALPGELSTPQFAAIEFSVGSLDRVVALLIEGDIAFERRDDRVVVPARAAMGVTLVFAEI